VGTHKATRVGKLIPSGIRRMFEIAYERKDVVNLSIGEPDFDVPDPVKQAAVEAIWSGRNRYTPTRGIPELRERLMAKLQAEGHRAEDVLVTAGATGALLVAMLALVDPGDEVLLFDPYFVAYPNVVILAGGVPRFVSTYPDFRPNLAALEKAVSPRCKAILLNSPNNPTGAVWTKDELQALVDFAEKHGLTIISDEVYELFAYDREFVSVGTLTDRALVINAFSKSAGMTGWRLGYVSGPADLLDDMALLQQYTHASLNSVAQFAALTALETPITDHVAELRRKRDYVRKRLSGAFELAPPEGAFYVFARAPGDDATAWAERCLEAGVLVIPGNTFSRRDTHFRNFVRGQLGGAREGGFHPVELRRGVRGLGVLRHFCLTKAPTSRLLQRGKKRNMVFRPGIKSPGWQESPPAEADLPHAKISGVSP